jgi:hypothetical protein
MRDWRRVRGRTLAGGVQAEKRQRYVRLIAPGVNNSEACRLVGSTARRETGGGMAGGSGISPGRLSFIRR